MQKIFLFASVIIPSVTALVALPILARHLDSSSLAIASIVIMCNTFFGILDINRPVIVRWISQDASFATVSNLVVPSLTMVCGILAASAISLSVFGTSHFQITDGVFIIGSAILFVFYSSFWAVLDAHGRVGSGQLVRAAVTVMLYVALSLSAVLDLGLRASSILFCLSLVALASYVVLSRNHVARGGLSVGRSYFSEMGSVLLQNAGKIVNDFGDRVVGSAMLPVSHIPIYNLNYEVASKGNIVSQLVCSYAFPKLCRDEYKPAAVMGLGLFISALLLLASVGFSAMGEGVYLLYFGEAFHSYLWAFSSMLSVTSFYSLSFFGQIILRSRAEHLPLTIAFWLSAIFGGLFLLNLVRTDNVSIASLVLAAAIFKGSSLFMIPSLLRSVGWGLALLALLLILGNAYLIAANIGAEWT